MTAFVFFNHLFYCLSIVTLLPFCLMQPSLLLSVNFHPSSAFPSTCCPNHSSSTHPPTKKKATPWIIAICAFQISSQTSTVVIYYSSQGLQLCAKMNKANPWQLPVYQSTGKKLINTIMFDGTRQIPPALKSHMVEDHKQAHMHRETSLPF